MRVISRRILIDFYTKYPDAKGPVEAWYAEAKAAVWKSFVDIKEKYRAADPIKDNRCVFNIGGNKYRLIVKIEFKIGIVFIRFIGTHKEYNQIKAEEI